MTATQTRLAFTTRPFERSHGRRPSGRGSWAFQEATSETAFESQLVGPVLFFQGTLTEAKRQLAQTGTSGLWAVLP